jgi:hypothetical protein
MSDATGKLPWHFWVVAILGIFWNGFGAFDYTMTHTMGEAYLRQAGMTEAQVAHYNAMPAWTHAVWAFGVWGAVAGTVLLLLRSQWALHAFAVSLAGFLISLVYNYWLSNGAAVNGQTALIMNGVILAGCLFFLWYAWSAQKAGRLR